MMRVRNARLGDRKLDAQGLAELRGMPGTKPNKILIQRPKTVATHQTHGQLAVTVIIRGTLAIQCLEI